LATKHAQLELLTIHALPEGWLGKNHALHQGVHHTSEEWILFTDADVLFHPEALSRAMGYALQQRLDHLTVLPEVHSPSPWLNRILETFKIMLEIRQRPWALRQPRSKASLGVGAFNLVQRKAYFRAGGHEAISLRPDDDLQLGRHIKESGGKQDALYGDGAVSLEWYRNVAEFVEGLMKNTFSVFQYRLGLALLAAFLTLFVFVLPLPLILLFGGEARWLAVPLLLAQASLYTMKRGMRGRVLNALLMPFAGSLMAYIIVASALRTLLQGGIYWRATFYPLKELRKQKG
jgi:glycosyltransferase involved in cell wall biosynthesis